MRKGRAVAGIVAGLAVAAAGTMAVSGALPRVLGHPHAAPSVSATPAAEPVETTAAATLFDVTTVVPGGVLDPAQLPERPVTRAALLIGVGWTDRTVLALDADTGTWVRTPLDANELDYETLSPDGTRLLHRTLSDDQRVLAQVVDLGTGRTTPVPVPPRYDDCQLDDTAWAPDGVHVAVIWGCGHYAPSDVLAEYGNYDTWQPYDTYVDEVDLQTWKTRQVEHVVDFSPGETYPSYSPDGRLLIYGAGPLTGDQEPSSLRVVALYGSGAVNVPGFLHIVYGDPWLGSDAALAWDEEPDPGSADSFDLIDATSGTHRPLGVASLGGVGGYVGGRLVVSRTDWLDRPHLCDVELCLMDPTTGAITPWLDLPGTPDMAFIKAARGLFRQ